ncbi:hypothetical protein BC830DRAFT_1105176 [Chytriomyces sp. MP71]|nr:hypothetical protein BC830DRAFT_1105176 [Chytriomyces sp. MP71]
MVDVCILTTVSRKLTSILNSRVDTIMFLLVLVAFIWSLGKAIEATLSCFTYPIEMLQTQPRSFSAGLNGCIFRLNPFLARYFDTRNSPGPMVARACFSFLKPFSIYLVVVTVPFISSPCKDGFYPLDRFAASIWLHVNHLCPFCAAPPRQARQHPVHLSPRKRHLHEQTLDLEPYLATGHRMSLYSIRQ